MVDLHKNSTKTLFRIPCVAGCPGALQNKRDPKLFDGKRDHKIPIGR